jgi:hypothetical protein
MSSSNGLARGEMSALCQGNRTNSHGPMATDCHGVLDVGPTITDYELGLKRIKRVWSDRLGEGAVLDHDAQEGGRGDGQGGAKKVPQEPDPGQAGLDRAPGWIHGLVRPSHRRVTLTIHR